MNKVVVITGAGSGIGRATARVLLDTGHHVVVAGRRPDQLTETARSHPNALVVPTDVTDSAAVRALFEHTVSAFGRVDVLFNNAGRFGPSGSVDQISLGDWNETIAVNLTGTMLCAAAAVRQMKEQDPPGGRIINNGSLSAIAPRPLAAAYTATKHAVTGLTKSIDLDGRAWGISCAQIDIGNAATELLDGITAGGALQPDGTRKAEPTFPAEEAARMVVFMAGLPASANPGSVVLTAAGMPYLGRG